MVAGSTPSDYRTSSGLPEPDQSARQGRSPDDQKKQPTDDAVRKDPRTHPADSSKAAIMNRRLKTAQEVADLIQLNKFWVHAATRANQIPQIRLGRNTRHSDEAIDEWLSEIQSGQNSRTAGRRH